MAIEVLFRATVIFCAFLPLRYILFFAILVRKTSDARLADKHVKFFLGGRLHDNLDKWLRHRFFANHFNEVAYFLLVSEQPADVLRHFERISWSLF
jgi:hypothetical protein